MVLLTLTSIAIGIAIYNINGTDYVEYTKYVQLMLPATFLISVIATSIIIMQKLTSA
jgi:hypothetical protein